MSLLRMNGERVLLVSKIQFALAKITSGEFVVKRLSLMKMVVMKVLSEATVVQRFKYL